MDTLNYKCPNCSAGLTFDSKEQKMKCEFCGSTYSLEELDKLAEQQDPRMLGQGDIFDSYPYMGSARDAWNRIKKGESVPARSINKSDFEPEASGLEVNF